MHYYYDVLANLDNTLWDFYEWEQTDNIVPIKKMPLVKVTEKDIKTFFKYQINFDSEWSSKFIEKTIVKNGKEKLSCILFSSGKNAIIIEIDETGKTISRSKLLVEDENNVNEIIYSIKETKVPYKIEQKLEIRKELRQAEKEKHFIWIELNTLKEKQNQIKCSFLYYEWFGEFESSMEKMLDKMKKELKREYTIKLHEIASLIRMSYKEYL